MVLMWSHSTCVLVLLHMLQQASSHSCYYWINYDPAGPRCGGKSGIAPAPYEKCVACAEAADPTAHNCTALLVSNACRGVTPEPPGPPHPPSPPSPPMPGALALTLLPQVWIARPRVCTHSHDLPLRSAATLTCGRLSTHLPQRTTTAALQRHPSGIAVVTPPIDTLAPATPRAAGGCQHRGGLSGRFAPGVLLARGRGT